MTRDSVRSRTSRKVIFIYFAAFLLVAFHQSGRVAEWLEGQADGRDGRWATAAGNAAVFIREKIEPFGPSLMNRIEDEYLARLPDITVGAKADPNAAPSPPAVEAATSITAPIAPPEIFNSAPAPENAGLARDTWAIVAAALSAAPKIFNPANVLLVGDSMMLEGLGPPLERSLKKYPGLAVSRTGRYGTGLCRLDVFDWLAYFKETLAKYKPDLVIITLGANDPQDIVNAPGRKKRVHLGTDEWKEIYGQRVTELLALAEAAGTEVFWVGLPIMGREPYGTRVAELNKVVADGCAAAKNCRFWDAWFSVADEISKYSVMGKDAEGATVRVRAKDSIHLTEKGGEIMAAKFLAETGQWVQYEQIGSVTEYTFASNLRGKETKYFVAAPRVVTGKIPAVFLLHGAWSGPESWLDGVGRDKLATLAQANNVILIMPDGDPFGWYLDGPEAPIESYIINELVPEVLAKQPIDKDRMAISGLSMGGHGALTLTMKHPGLFKAVSSMSGVMDLSAHGDNTPLNQSINIHKVLGDFAASGEAWLKNSVVGLTSEKPEALKGLPILLSVGLADNLTLGENQRYHQILETLRIPHEYAEDEGGHDWEYWSGQLGKHLDFLAGHLWTKNKKKK